MRLDDSMQHIALHFVIPLIVARIFYCNQSPIKDMSVSRSIRPYLGQWLTAWLIMCLTMLVDLDHLLATPIYDPMRCSINFHPLHTYWAISIYCILVGIKKTRLVGIGLLIHMLLDWQDCYFKI
jgi:hypothetical protein